MMERVAVDRRSGLDRRDAYDLEYFKRGGVERRTYSERRQFKERRTDWARISTWSSTINPWPNTHLSQVDFEKGEEIELIGNIDTEQYSNLQYFSTRTEFRNRFSALMGWISNTEVNAIYGIITINEAFVSGKDLSIDSAQGEIAKFEDIFIRNIRIFRKYIPPVRSESNKRKSDNTNYRNPRGNFDLACMTPGAGNSPYVLEFLLYDCDYDDALKKLKTFEGFAQDLSLETNVEIIFHNTGHNTWVRKTKSRFLRRMPTRWTNRRKQKTAKPIFGRSSVFTGRRQSNDATSQKATAGT